MDFTKWHNNQPCVHIPWWFLFYRDLTDKGRIVWYDYVDGFFATFDYKFYWEDELTKI